MTKALRLPSAAKDTKWMRAQRASTKDGQTVTDVVLGQPTYQQDCARATLFGTPSGTASHIELETAIDSSLRELIERDAVTRAWNGLGEIERVQ
ncbi:YcaO-like family protein [Actinomyces sp.]|uniref:YcaO-like family protein n=1 Tax=Actinomyces sp. TaxID=29317 RepID=UPI0037BF729A